MRKKSLIIALILLLLLTGCGSPNEPEVTLDSDSVVENYNFAVPQAFFQETLDSNPSFEEIQDELAIYNATAFKNSLDNFTFPLSTDIIAGQEMNSLLALPKGQGFYPHLDEDLRKFWSDSYLLVISDEDRETWIGETIETINTLIEEIIEIPDTIDVLLNPNFTSLTLYTTSDKLFESYNENHIYKLYQYLIRYQYLTKDTDRSVILHAKNIGEGFILELKHREIGAIDTNPSLEISFTEEELKNYTPIITDKYLFWLFPRGYIDGMTNEELAYEMALLDIPVGLEPSNEDGKTLFVLYLTPEKHSELLVKVEGDIIDALERYKANYLGESLTYSCTDDYLLTKIIFADREPEIDILYHDEILRKIDAYYVLRGNYGTSIPYVINFINSSGKVFMTSP